MYYYKDRTSNAQCFDKLYQKKIKTFVQFNTSHILKGISNPNSWTYCFIGYNAMFIFILIFDFDII